MLLWLHKLDFALQTSPRCAYFHAVSETAVATRDLDVRSLDGAEPIVRILRELDTVKPDEQLKVQLSNVPFQLYDLVQQRGFCIQYERDGTQVLATIARRKLEAVGNSASPG